MTIAKPLLSFLNSSSAFDFGNAPIGFNWLMSNYDYALKVMQTPGHQDVNIVTTHLIDGWKNRDGGIGTEISVFFEEGLKYNTWSIIKLFLQNKDQLKPWVERISFNMFTDYRGERSDELMITKNTIERELDLYIKQQITEEERKVATPILEAIRKTDVTEIQ